MEQERMLRRNRRKKVAIAIAAVIALALAGTFAWANYTQLALNEAVSSAQQGGRLHDDFTFKTAAASNKASTSRTSPARTTGAFPYTPA